MKMPKFSALLKTCTALIFILSFYTLALAASERGVSTGLEIFTTPSYVAPANARLSLKSTAAKVKGYTIGSATLPALCDPATLPSSKYLKVIEPTSGLIRLVNYKTNIGWTHTGDIKTVSVGYKKGQSGSVQWAFQNIPSQAPSACSEYAIDWTIPANTAVGTDYYITITGFDVNGQEVVSTTADTAFSIVNYPNVTDFSPRSSAPGATITVTGTGFTPTDNKVLWGTWGGTLSHIANVTSNGTQLQFVVPSTATNGNYNFKIVNSNGDGNLPTFTVTGGSTTTTPSTQCAGAGLDVNVYGGPNHVCCAGLVLQGGLCNVAPSSAGCTDSDGGRDITKKGTTCRGSQCYTDYCPPTNPDGKKIYEYWCAADGSVTTLMHYCSDGYACSDGACIPSSSVPVPTPIQPPVTIQPQSCTDTDNGKNETAKGSITISGYATPFTDYCLPNGKSLIEYFCPSYQFNEIICQLGCTDGACKAGQISCTDGDNGLDWTKKAQITLTSSGVVTTKEDVCIYTNPANGQTSEVTSCTGAGCTIREYGCTPYGNESNLLRNCGQYGCTNGVCLDSAQQQPVIQCAQAGLRADIYGGPNQICCAGLVLQGGVCNVQQGTHTCVFKPYDGRNYVESLSYSATVSSQNECLALGDKWKNNACTNISVYTNYLFYDNAQIHITTGDCCLVQNGECKVQSEKPQSAPSITILSPNGGESWEAGSTHKITWKSTGIPTDFDGFIKLYISRDTTPMAYPDITIPHGNPGFYDLTLWDGLTSANDYRIQLMTCWQTTSGYTCDSSHTLFASDTSDGTFNITASTTTTKVIVCHKTGADAYQELTMNKDGWNNGHIQHSGDFIKNGEGTCAALAPKKTITPYSGNQDDGPVQVPGLTTSPQTPTQTTQDKKDELIRRLLERIDKLEYRLSELENKVITREQERETKVNKNLTEKLKGRMLLQVEQKGEVWFIGYDGKKYYLANGDTAYQILKAFGTGITEADFAKLSETASTPFGKAHAGMIFIRVQSKGEAYYITKDGIAIYVKDGPAAYQVMKYYSLGATDATISQLETGNLDASSQE